MLLPRLEPRADVHNLSGTCPFKRALHGQRNSAGSWLPSDNLTVDGDCVERKQFRGMLSAVEQTVYEDLLPAA